MLELFNKLNTIEDLEKFIQGASADTDTESRENTKIEYKEANQTLPSGNEVGKDVSAFANSEGGIIFFGISCEGGDKTKPKEISGLNPKYIETLDRIINSHISAPIPGIRKKLIPNNNPQVMLLYVPQSDVSPHQNNNGKYYMRLGSETRHMPHYLVELHFGKRRKPKLSVQLTRFPQPQLPSFTENYSPICHSQISISNSGKAVARYVQAIFLFPADAIGSDGNGYLRHLQHQSHVLDEVSHRFRGKIAWEFQNNQGVIHPTTNWTIGPFQFQFHRDLIFAPVNDENSPVIKWEIYAEGMEPQKGQANIFSFFGQD